MQMQVMSSTVADALTYDDRDETTETRVFIRMIDNFFDCLNVKCRLEGVKKRKPFREAYTHTKDERFKVASIASSYTVDIVDSFFSSLVA